MLGEVSERQNEENGELTRTYGVGVRVLEIGRELDAALQEEGGNHLGDVERDVPARSIIARDDGSSSSNS